jgi:hypothetical protein
MARSSERGTMTATRAILLKRLEAEALQIRRNVWRAFPGRASGYPTGPPTDPDVRNSRIRFLGSQSFGTTLAHHCAALHGQIR